MGSKWHHVVAATVGLVLAGLMVFFVFGSADEEGAAQDGAAPDAVAASQNAGGSAGCGEFGPDAVTGKPARTAARANLPAIIDATGQEVRLTDKRQRALVANLHAAVSLCTTEITIRPNEDPAIIDAAATMPEEMQIDAVSGYVMQFLAVAFTTDVFIIREVSLRFDHGDEERSLRISRRVWETFREQRQALSLPDSVSGLTRLDERVGYARNEFDSRGW